MVEVEGMVGGVRTPLCQIGCGQWLWLCAREVDNVAYVQLTALQPAYSPPSNLNSIEALKHLCRSTFASAR